jgi:cyclopropane fatty-acyl-phospholipid synthase-like methyltransferase
MTNLKEILDHIWGVAPLKVVSMTIQCGFWNYISNNPQTSKTDLLKQFNWQERPFERVADLLVDLKLIQISNGNVKLTHISQKWLVEDSKDYIGDFIVRANELSKAYDNIGDMMCNDKPDTVMHKSTINVFGKDNNSTMIFSKSMSAMTREFMSEITSHINFGRINRVLDIGAGLGTISCYLSDLYPEKQFTILDLEGVAELSRQYVNDNAAHPDKIRVIDCDVREESNWRKKNEEYTKNSSFDLIILSQILHELTKEETKSLVKKCSDLLVEGGKLVIIGFLDNSDKYKMLSHIFSLNMLFEMGSDNPNKDEITQITKQNNIAFDSEHYLSAGRMLWIGSKKI